VIAAGDQPTDHVVSPVAAPTGGRGWCPVNSKSTTMQPGEESRQSTCICCKNEGTVDVLECMIPAGWVKIVVGCGCGPSGTRRVYLDYLLEDLPAGKDALLTLAAYFTHYEARIESLNEGLDTISHASVTLNALVPVIPQTSQESMQELGCDICGLPSVNQQCVSTSYRRCDPCFRKHSIGMTGKFAFEHFDLEGWRNVPDGPKSLCARLAIDCIPLGLLETMNKNVQEQKEIMQTQHAMYKRTYAILLTMGYEFNVRGLFTFALG
jgi:hypothetical protein